MTLVCFSHLRWNRVFQRPQHLMSLLAKRYPVIFWEQPWQVAPEHEPRIETYSPADNIMVVVPHLPEGLDQAETTAALRMLLDACIADAAPPVIRWYDTPMMLPFSRHLDVSCTIYDCMEELNDFRFAPPQQEMLEAELLRLADHVFTSSYGLYEAKRDRNALVHLVRSSVDPQLFMQTRGAQDDPADQACLPRPRLGCCGVIDERVDLDFICAIADARPEWTLIFLGPILKINPVTLPQRPNIAYLGRKNPADLPRYVGGWDIALMPRAIDASTRFMSSTQILEYLAAGLPVVSTPILDVSCDYGDLEGVGIAADPAAFVAACERALNLAHEPQDAAWRRQAGEILADRSWQAAAVAINAKIDEKMCPQSRRERIPIILPSRSSPAR